MHPLVDFKTRPMTEDEILAVLRDMHRHWSAEDGDPVGVINYDTTVEEYWSALGVDTKLGFNPGEVWNEHFRVGFSNDDWARVLRPYRARSLREVCAFLAGRAHVAHVEPMTLLDRPCLSAGIFLTIRTLLAHAGADVTDLRPSSELGPYLIDWYPVLLRDVAKIAPGTLPVLKIVHPLNDVCACTLAGSCLLGCLTGFLASIPVCPSWQLIFGAIAAVCLVAGIATYIGGWITAKVPPRRVEFGSLRDFRDLVRALAGEAIPVTSP